MLRLFRIKMHNSCDFSAKWYILKADGKLEITADGSDSNRIGTYTKQ